MDYEQFKVMNGRLGESFMGERIFFSMNMGQKITLEDWLVYNDIVYHGTQEEKNKLNFRMLDLNGCGSISFEVYEAFWVSFLQFYTQIMGIDLHYDDKMKKVTRTVFDLICDGGSSFVFEDY